MENTINISSASLLLLLALIRDSGNWSNNPLLDVTSAQRGNLTQLKVERLLRTSRSDGNDWVYFTFEQGQLVTDGNETFRLTRGDYHSEAEAVIAAAIAKATGGGL